MHLGEPKMSDVPSVLKIEQVTDGLEYKGHITFNGHRLFWHMKLTRSLEDLQQDLPTDIPTDEAERESYIRNLFGLSILREENGTPVELDTDTFGLFFELLFTFVIRFYEDPQTRDSQQGYLGLAMRGEFPGFGPVKAASVGMESKPVYRFSDEAIDLVSKIVGKRIV
ncbi:MAG: hypothetical protein K0S38_4 [Candidatus Paceibacter sp.]|jgi:hypothetical protein|nr:hypothetical protein [Candidatus Paceibacter sp.]